MNKTVIKSGVTEKQVAGLGVTAGKKKKKKKGAAGSKSAWDSEDAEKKGANATTTKADTEKAKNAPPPGSGSAADPLGLSADDAWNDDGLGGIYNKDGWTKRVTNDGGGLKIYKAHLLPCDKKTAGQTPDCPFDCDCCFGWDEGTMEGYLKSVS